MNTDQVFSALKCIVVPFCISNFDVIPADFLEAELNKNKEYPKVYIVNTLASYSRSIMGHWICVFAIKNKLNDSKISVFDSFGKPLTFFNRKLFKFLAEEERNKKTLQNMNSDVCAKYALFYVYYKLRNYSMKRITDMFSRSTIENDLIVNRFYSNLKVKMIKGKCKCKQRNCSQKQVLLKCKNNK